MTACSLHLLFVFYICFESNISSVLSPFSIISFLFITSSLFCLSTGSGSIRSQLFFYYFFCTISNNTRVTALSGHPSSSFFLHFFPFPRFFVFRCSAPMLSVYLRFFLSMLLCFSASLLFCFFTVHFYVFFVCPFFASQADTNS